MNMKKIITVMCGLMAVMTLSAATVSKEQARQQALSFLQKSSSRHQAPANVSLREVAVSNNLYVFNVGDNGGFVIVSGDDCTGDLVLGYADEGRFVAENMPENLKAWMNGYERQIEWMKEKGIVNDAAASRGVKKAGTRQSVAPLLTCHWNQDEPYNTYCPSLNSEGTYLSVTGCVATATAQVMYYQANKNRISTTTTYVIPSYNSTRYYLYIGGVKTITIPAKAAITIDWTKIVDDYPASAAANEQVARLMEYVGAGLQMQYGPASTGGSEASSSSIPNCLTKYFGYDKDIALVDRNNYSYSEWLDLIYGELTTNGPVIYSGQSTTGGHCFVVDGFSEEDMFHINWGWGGKSDGYFKLSVLYSEQQGIGGSSSQEGYNHGQDAIIGVNPIDDGTPDTSVRLTVTKAWPGQSSATRTASNVNFNNVLLYYSLYNKTGETQSFEYGYAIEIDGDLVELSNNTVNDLPNNYGWNQNECYVSFGADLSDGTYKLIPISRESGTSTWYPDYGSEVNQILATISGNTVTLASKTNIDLSTTLSVSSSPTQNAPVTVTASITNNGTLYSGDLILGKQTGADSYSTLSAQQVEIAEGASSTITFTFTPTESGDMTLWLLDKNENLLTDNSITIIASSATTGTLSIEESGVIFTNGVNPSDYSAGFYGTRLEGSVVVNNTSPTLHNSGITVQLMEHVSGTSYIGTQSKSYSFEVAGNSNGILNFSFDGLTIGQNYYLIFKTSNGTKFYETYYVFSSVEGITTYLADGTETTIAPAASVTVGNDVVAIDVSQINTVTSVTPNSNPNTLYFVGASVPSGLTGKNVVQNGVAAELNLTDGYAFYTPQDFTATTATYTRTFTNGADGTNGWTTIVLPFDVTTVKEGENTIDWFRSDSDSKNFWLKEFTSESGSTVNFGYATSMKANKPYIIAMPGNKWGAKWDLTNKAISFIGSNVNIQADAVSSTSGFSYKFAGNTRSVDVTDVYVMNNDGNSFEKTTTTVPPFRASFYQLKMTVGSPKTLAIGSESSRPTGIGAVTMPTDGKKGVYTLDGRRVSTVKHGVYIIDGKKVVK